VNAALGEASARSLGQAEMFEGTDAIVLPFRRAARERDLAHVTSLASDRDKAISGRPHGGGSTGCKPPARAGGRSCHMGRSAAAIPSTPIIICGQRVADQPGRPEPSTIRPPAASSRPCRICCVRMCGIAEATRR
jgi:hypothetical protein